MIDIDTQSYNFLEGLRKNWFLLIFVASLIIGWTNVQARQSVAESDIDRLEIGYADLTKTTNTLNQNIVEIKTSLLFIQNIIEKND